MLSRDQARAFYDRFGAKQDRQGFYEDPALDELLAHAGFEHAESVFELGCGTGRLAAKLLTGCLPETARYLGHDLSSTMVALARRRLAPFAGRAEVELTPGAVALDLPDRSFDRFLSTYVLDLLPDAENATLLREAHRVLVPEGRLCLVSLTGGVGGLSRLVSGGWRWIHRLRPSWVGGCRPLETLPLLDASLWEVRHHRKIVAYGITSEVVVASRLL